MRHELSWQRTTRNPLFIQGRHAQVPPDGSTALSRLDSLRGVPAGARRCILGSLVQIEEGSVFLEDAYAVVKLDISRAETFGGFFAEGMVIIAEGSMGLDGEVFIVDALGHPPFEPRDLAFRAVGGRHLDVFLNNCGVDRDMSRDAPWLVIANCHLDSPAALPRLRSLLVGLALPICEHYCTTKEKVPKRPVIIFLGDFTSRTSANSGAQSVTSSYRFRFGELGAALCAPELDIGQESMASLIDLVFIPGPNDPVAGSPALPRGRLLQQAIQPLVDRIKIKTNGTAPIFTTSPARFRFGHGEEIVFHRDDLLRKLRQLSRHIAGCANHIELVDSSAHLAKTLLDQCHLAPFAPSLSPKHWNYDHTLRLYPPPSILCLSDDTAPPFTTEYENVKVFNPGNFACDGSFVLFRPNSGEIEISRVP
jgi:DNA polymerase epsilon subunit 2